MHPGQYQYGNYQIPPQQPLIQAQPGLSAEELAELKKLKEEMDANKKSQNEAKDETNAALQAQVDELKKTQKA